MDIPGAFAKHSNCGNCPRKCRIIDQEPQPIPKKQKTPKSRSPPSQFLCPCCGTTQQQKHNSMNINGIRLAIAFDHRFRALFVAAMLDLSDPDCKFSVCSNCYNVCSGTLKQVEGLIPTLFSLKSINKKHAKSKILPPGTVFKLSDEPLVLLPPDILLLIIKKY
jgi:hypothetical protein